METILWCLDLVGVAFLCLWALREDRRSGDGGAADGVTKEKRH